MPDLAESIPTAYANGPIILLMMSTPGACYYILQFHYVLVFEVLYQGLNNTFLLMTRWNNHVDQILSYLPGRTSSFVTRVLESLCDIIINTFQYVSHSMYLGTEAIANA